MSCEMYIKSTKSAKIFLQKSNIGIKITEIDLTN